MDLLKQRCYFIGVYNDEEAKRILNTSCCLIQPTIVRGSLFPSVPLPHRYTPGLLRTQALGNDIVNSNMDHELIEPGIDRCLPRVRAVADTADTKLSIELFMDPRGAVFIVRTYYPRNAVWGATFANHERWKEHSICDGSIVVDALNNQPSPCLLTSCMTTALKAFFTLTLFDWSSIPVYVCRMRIGDGEAYLNQAERDNLRRNRQDFSPAEHQFLQAYLDLKILTWSAVLVLYLSKKLSLLKCALQEELSDTDRECGFSMYPLHALCRAIKSRLTKLDWTKDQHGCCELERIDDYCTTIQLNPYQMFDGSLEMITAADDNGIRIAALKCHLSQPGIHQPPPLFGLDDDNNFTSDLAKMVGLPCCFLNGRYFNIRVCLLTFNAINGFIEYKTPLSWLTDQMSPWEIGQTRAWLTTKMAHMARLHTERFILPPGMDVPGIIVGQDEHCVFNTADPVDGKAMSHHEFRDLQDHVPFFKQDHSYAKGYGTGRLGIRKAVQELESVGDINSFTNIRSKADMNDLYLELMRDGFGLPENLHQYRWGKDRMLSWPTLRCFADSRRANYLKTRSHAPTAVYMGILINYVKTGGDIQDLVWRIETAATVEANPFTNDSNKHQFFCAMNTLGERVPPIPTTAAIDELALEWLHVPRRRSYLAILAAYKMRMRIEAAIRFSSPGGLPSTVPTSSNSDNSPSSEGALVSASDSSGKIIPHFSRSSCA